MKSKLTVLALFMQGSVSLRSDIDCRKFAEKPDDAELTAPHLSGHGVA
jgi:hypothetical protein